MSTYERAKDRITGSSCRWLVTGAAGFIGSSLVEHLLKLGQHVVGLDNFSTGQRTNLEDVRSCVGPDVWQKFQLIEGDLLDLDVCRSACAEIDYVLHQAALGSVPRSLADPIATNASNITGTLHMLVAARDAKVRRFVFAASSSTYGDHPALPKVEDAIGRPLSPYAVTKYVSELYASVFQRSYQIQTIGLRYFNVFGRRQDPNGAYAAVIPRWVASLLRGDPCTIYGDGETSRDFCYVDNVVQANVLAATAEDDATDQVYNIAYGERTTLRELFCMIRDGLVIYKPDVITAEPRFEEFRPGDVRHSLADITRARTRLGYAPAFSVAAGMWQTLAWFAERELEVFGGWLNGASPRRAAAAVREPVTPVPGAASENGRGESGVRRLASRA